MKIAEFKKYKYMNGRREVFTIWLQLKDNQMELFHGPITEYRVYGWERHTVQLVIDAMKLVLTKAQFEVRGDI